MSSYIPEDSLYRLLSDVPPSPLMPLGHVKNMIQTPKATERKYTHKDTSNQSWIQTGDNEVKASWDQSCLKEESKRFFMEVMSDRPPG